MAQKTLLDSLAELSALEKRISQATNEREVLDLKEQYQQSRAEAQYKLGIAGANYTEVQFQSFVRKAAR